MPYKNKTKRNEYQRKYQAKQRSIASIAMARNEYQNKWKRNQRLEILKHYSNGKPKCAKCGIDDIRVLSIDHINGGGRKQIMETRKSLPQWIINNNYPEGFQILCMNCQFIKAAENKEWNKYENT